MAFAAKQAAKGRDILIVAGTQLRGQILADNIPAKVAAKIGVTSTGHFRDVKLVPSCPGLHTIIIENVNGALSKLKGYAYNEFEDKIASLLVSPDSPMDPVIYIFEKSDE